MDKVFVVSASLGQQYYSHPSVIKVFESEIEAHSYAEKYDRVITKVSNFYKDILTIVLSNDYTGYTEEDYQRDFYVSIWTKYSSTFGLFLAVNVYEVPLVLSQRNRNLEILLD